MGTAGSAPRSAAVPLHGAAPGARPDGQSGKKPAVRCGVALPVGGSVPRSPFSVLAAGRKRRLKALCHARSLFQLWKNGRLELLRVLGRRVGSGTAEPRACLGPGAAGTARRHALAGPALRTERSARRPGPRRAEAAFGRSCPLAAARGGAARHGTAPRAARRHCSRPARRGTPAAQPRQRSGVGSAARCGRCARGRSECSPCSVIDLDSLSFASGIFHPLEYGVWGPFHH